MRSPDYIYREALTRDILNIGLVINPSCLCLDFSKKPIRLTHRGFIPSCAFRNNLWRTCMCAQGEGGKSRL